MNNTHTEMSRTRYHRVSNGEADTIDSKLQPTMSYYSVGGDPDFAYYYGLQSIE